MSARKISFENNHIYHIFNRGVEKRNIFLKEGDYLHFIHDLFELNNQSKSPNITHYFKNLRISSPKFSKKPRELLVEILAFTLMPNHFHLLLKQKVENGIPRFLQKLGTGHAMFFNKKYDRVGSLFQGKFKAILVDKDEYLIHLLNYIHFNPLKLNLRDKTFKVLSSYRWSSFLDYIGEKNFPSVTSREFLFSFFNSEEKYKVEAQEWLKEKDKHILTIKDFILD